MGLMDKMYEDGKFAAKERKKKNEEEGKKAEREKKRREEEAERKRKAAERKAKRKKKDKEWTLEDKRNYSILALIMIPIFQLFFIYHQGSWLEIVLQCTKNSKYLKQWLPDGEGVPYGKGEQGSGITCKEIKKLMPDRKKEGGDTLTKKAEPPKAANPRDAGAAKPGAAAAKPGEAADSGVAKANPPKAAEGPYRQKGGRRKRYVQKGGFNKELNEKKDFFDSTKYGLPYSWVENDNFIMSGIGNYYKTFWQGQRGGLKMILEGVNEAFFKDHKEPTNLGEQAYDFVKFAVILPIVNFVAHLGQVIGGLVLLFWASFNNQSLMILPFFIAAICHIFLGWLTGYFWPWGLFGAYLTAFNLRPNAQKLANFRTYGRRYKFMWCFSILFWWFIIIGGYIWKWEKIILMWLAMIGALFLLGMLGVSTLV